MTVDVTTRGAALPALTALFLTADPADARQRIAGLAQAGMPVSAEIVGTLQAFEEAVASGRYDFVAAEYALSGWTGMDAVAHLQARGSGTPVILISSGLDDETAAECLRSGAAEHVRADRPGLLAAAIGRVVKPPGTEQRYRLLMERSVAGVLRADLDGCILDANLAMARMMGFRAPDDLLGRRTADFYSTPAFRNALIERLLAEGSLSHVEIQLTRADGASIWVTANIYLEGGTVVEGTLVEITERKRAQERSARLNRLYSVLSRLNQAIVRIRERDALFQAVCRIAVEDGGFRVAGIGLLDHETGVIRLAAHHGFGGGSLEQVCIHAGHSAALRNGGEFVVNDTAERCCSGPSCDAAVALGNRSCAILPLTVDRRLAGALTLYASEPGFFDEQNLQLCRSMAEDVAFALENMAHEAEHRRAEEEHARMHLSEQAARTQALADARYRELIEAAPDAILESDAAGRVLVANAAAERLFQYTREELLGLRIEDLLPGADHDGGPRSRGEGQDLRARRKDKTEFPVEITVSRVDSDRGKLVTYIIRDITGRKQAEAALLESNRRIGNIFESITDAFFALDRQWRYTYVNGKAEQMLGRRREDVLGKKIWDEFPDLVKTIFDQEYHQAAAEQRPVEFTAFDAERKLWADVHVYPSEHGLSVYLQDITARKLLEEQYGQSQRLEALGRLAGGVAHDFNNLLTIIGGYGQMLLDSIDGRNPIRKDVEPIVEAATRASALTRQLLTFSRRQLLQPKVVDLNRLIMKMNKMLRRVIGEDIELKLALRPDLGRTKADPGQIEQVIMNLAINARDAMPTGGLLTIATDNYEAVLEDETSGLPAGGCVLLTVSDTGTGMDERTRSHIFEPFFTTKAKGKGTGLGLSTAYGIVKQAGGEIRVDSEPGKGATFQIYLPRTKKTPKAHRAQAAPRRPRKGSETILLVEDEPEVRKLTREMLVRLGYRVLEARDGAQALEVWRERCDSVDLLLTDVIMPHKSGRELAEELTGLRPGLKVLYMSGYTDEVIARHGIGQDDAALLPKPFSPEALGLKVRSILDAHRVSS
jgi:PAS domain S-box-containing protein